MAGFLVLAEKELSHLEQLGRRREQKLILELLSHLTLSQNVFLVVIVLQWQNYGGAVAINH